MLKLLELTAKLSLDRLIKRLLLPPLDSNYNGARAPPLLYLISLTTSALAPPVY